MNNFDDAFFVGIDAARSVRRSQREIDSILKEFSASLEVATNGRVTVSLKDRAASLGDLLVAKSKESKRSKRLVVHAVAPDSAQPPIAESDVALFRSSTTGYPSWLVYGGQEFICNDKLGLEAELATLAASPVMGQAVLHVIEIQDASDK